jgi:hypothetical protein
MQWFRVRGFRVHGFRCRNPEPHNPELETGWVGGRVMV